MINQNIEVLESTARGMTPGQLVEYVENDISNELSVIISAINPNRRRSTRLPRMYLTFPCFRRYS